MPSKRKTVKRKSRKCKKRVKKNMICFSSKNKKMTKKMKRIGKRLLKTKGIKLSRCSKRRLTSAKKRKSKKLKKKKRKKRKRGAKGMPTKPVNEIDIGDIDTDNLETPEPTPEDTILQPVAQNAIAFPTFSDDGNDITINIDGNQETVKENKGLNFKELVDYLNNADNNTSLVFNRYRYSNGDVYKSEIQLDNYDQNNGFLTVIDIDYGGQYHIQPEDFICNYEADQPFCYTHGHARDMPNEIVDVYEIIPQN
tara:strand:- start:962 stop:1720 length:759 start_codon:yes stop_codon:yes gene_type:complete